jgi:hypothetical protein
MSALSMRVLAGPGRRTVLTRAALALVAAGNAEVGVWGTAAPRSFFDNFPGFGHHWVIALGQYNEHLVRDFTAADLGFGVLLAIAAWWWGRRLVLAAGAAFLAANVPHLAYHLTTTSSFETGDNIGSLGSFAVEIAVVAFAMWLVTQDPETKET